MSEQTGDKLGFISGTGDFITWGGQSTGEYVVLHGFEPVQPVEHEAVGLQLVEPGSEYVASPFAAGGVRIVVKGGPGPGGVHVYDARTGLELSEIRDIKISIPVDDIATATLEVNLHSLEFEGAVNIVQRCPFCGCLGAEHEDHERAVGVEE